ncbi:MAG: hypothetical protein K6F35_04090 [Lachnospiraceae bacterium]|nr:hypothetical protein [Lachnospiraceae bacterium]
MKRRIRFMRKMFVLWLLAAILTTQAPVGISANELPSWELMEMTELAGQEVTEMPELTGQEILGLPELPGQEAAEPEDRAGKGAEEPGRDPAGGEKPGDAEPANEMEETGTGGITTWNELQEAITEAGTEVTTITLEQDITAVEGDAFLSIPEKARLTLDLNGYKLDRNLAGGSASADGCVIKLSSGTGSSDSKRTKLTIIDNSEAGTGLITGGNSSDPAGGVYVSANSLFTLVSGTISGNTASGGGGVHVANSGTFLQEGGMICGNFAIGNGGGVNGYGSFTMNGGIISSNTAATSGGGVYVHDSKSFTMNGGIISSNTGKNGGGVYNSGTFTMNGGTVCDNTATGNGGGVYNKRTFVMNNGKICNNDSKGAGSSAGGGGVYVDGASIADFTMTGGSISANHSARYGGGVYNNNTFNMNGGEIRDNRCDTQKSGGGVFDEDRKNFCISGNIAVSDNTAGGAVNNVQLKNIYTYIKISGLLSAGSSVGVTTASDPQNTIPIPVTKNLREKNAGDPGFLFSDKGFGVKLTDDKKEACLYLKTPQSINIVPSLYGTVTGKPEASPGETVVLTTIPDGGCSTESLSVNYTDDGGAFVPVSVTRKQKDQWIFTMPDREVYVSAVFKPEEWKSLDFSLAKGGTVKLEKDYEAGDTDTYLSISADNAVTLDLNGHTLNRNLSSGIKDDGYVIKVEGSLTITDSSTEKNGSITGGWSRTFCGGVYVSGNGTLTLNEGGITGNYGFGSVPGGVFLGPGTSFTMNGGRISGNEGRIGGGVHIGYGASFIMNEGEVRENNATGFGGGVYLEPGASFKITGGQISGNTVYGSGGGVYIEPGASCSMNGGLITKNSGGFSSNSHGGGVYNGGSFFLTAGDIRDNSAFMGGGIFNQGSLMIKGGSITGNTAYGSLSQSIGRGGGIYQDGLLIGNCETRSASSQF